MSRRPAPRSLATYTKATLGSAAALSAVGTAHSAIVFFDVDPAKTIGVAGDPTNQTVSFSNINLGAGTYNVSIGYGAPVYYGPTFWFTIPGENQFTAQGAGGMGLVGTSDELPGGGLSLLTAGTEISAASKYLAGVSMSKGEWNGGGTGYVGLVLNDGTNIHYGWMALDYIENGPATTLTVSGFAFEDTPGTPILAGATPAIIPEPGTMAVGAGLFALAVGAHLRRRREKKTAASDALLNLAAGARGVEKFRADKAA